MECHLWEKISFIFNNKWLQLIGFRFIFVNPNKNAHQKSAGKKTKRNTTVSKIWINKKKKTTVAAAALQSSCFARTTVYSCASEKCACYCHTYVRIVNIEDVDKKKRLVWIDKNRTVCCRLAMRYDFCSFQSCRPTFSFVLFVICSGSLFTFFSLPTDWRTVLCVPLQYHIISKLLNGFDWLRNCNSSNKNFIAFIVIAFKRKKIQINKYYIDANFTNCFFFADYQKCHWWKHEKLHVLNEICGVWSFFSVFSLKIIQQNRIIQTVCKWIKLDSMKPHCSSIGDCIALI